MTIKYSMIASLVALSLSSYSVNADSLLEVYQSAKLKDPVILKSKARYDNAVEQITDAKAALLPQIGFGLDSNYVDSSQNATDNTNYGGNISLSQSIYNGNYWQQFDIAEKQAMQFAAIYGNAAQDLILRTSIAYFAILRADEAVKSVQANKRAVSRQLEQTKQRFEVGLIAITDVHEAQAEYDRTVASEIIAQNDLDNSYYALREITGEDIRNISFLNTKTFSTQPLNGDAQVWRNTSIDKNLDLHSKRIAKEIAKMQIDLAEKGHNPTLDLVADVGYRDIDYDKDDFRSGDASTGSIGLKFSVPLYTGGKLTSQVKQAQYNYVYMSEELVESFRLIESQVSRGYNDVGASISSIRAYEQTVVSSQSALKATEAGFEVGTRTIVDVLDSTRKLYSAENQLANARYDYIVSVLQLKYSAGTLSEQDVIDISAGLVEKDPNPAKQPDDTSPDI
ncbi:outer membrane channel protein TolC [Psychromonas sp. MME2]|uniref:outer membrane channel protein TolC n=1 Tax=unclassified Psychromonas TaxID=2614957 RepID=UPI00339C1FC4